MSVTGHCSHPLSHLAMGARFSQSPLHAQRPAAVVQTPGTAHLQLPAAAQSLQP